MYINLAQKQCHVISKKISHKPFILFENQKSKRYFSSVKIYDEYTLYVDLFSPK